MNYAKNIPVMIFLNNTLVEVIQRDGTIYVGYSDDIDWDIEGEPSDIVWWKTYESCNLDYYLEGNE